MAETGGTTPRYKLDSSTIAAVGKAGKSGSKARGILDESSNKGNALAGIAGATGEAWKGLVRDPIQAKRKAKIAAAEKWDKAFDAQGERGAWTTEDLHAQFTSVEKEARGKYIEAVRSGDKGEIAKLLKAQASRSNALQSWKGTMESAQKINNGVGWSQALKNDTTGKKDVLEALSVMGPEISETMEVDENGEMSFEYNSKRYTRREIDKMVAEGVKPLQKELDYVKGLEGYQKQGADGKPFVMETAVWQNAQNIKKEDIPAMMFEDYGGGGSFADHMQEHEEFQKAFNLGGYAYNDIEKLDTPYPEGHIKYDADNPTKGDGVISQKEMKNFDEEDMQLILNKMPEDEQREYLSKWQGEQQKRSHELGQGDVQTSEQKAFKGLTPDQRNKMPLREAYRIQFGMTEAEYDALGITED
jgi:hypothetical protein